MHIENKQSLVTSHLRGLDLIRNRAPNKCTSQAKAPHPTLVPLHTAASPHSLGFFILPMSALSDPQAPSPPPCSNSPPVQFPFL